MTKAGERLIKGAEEALAIAKGEKPAAAIYHRGFRYVLDPSYEIRRVLGDPRVRVDVPVRKANLL